MGKKKKNASSDSAPIVVAMAAIGNGKKGLEVPNGGAQNSKKAIPRQLDSFEDGTRGLTPWDTTSNPILLSKLSKAPTARSLSSQLNSPAKVLSNTPSSSSGNGMLDKGKSVDTTVVLNTVDTVISIGGISCPSPTNSGKLPAAQTCNSGGLGSSSGADLITPLSNLNDAAVDHNGPAPMATGGNLNAGEDFVPPVKNNTGGNRGPKGGIPLAAEYEGVGLQRISFVDLPVKEIPGRDCCLVGYFSPKFPGFQALQLLVDEFACHCTYKKHPSGWIKFQFDKVEDMNTVLEGGPYYIYGRSLHLRLCPAFFDFSLEAQAKMSLWVQFHNLPLECWEGPYLNRLCTFVGTPHRTDKITEEQEAIGYARCLIEVDISRQLPTSVLLDLPKDTTVKVKIEYENLPKFCHKCRRLGHVEVNCNTEDSATFVPKKRLKPQAQGTKQQKKNIKSDKVWKPKQNDKSNDASTVAVDVDKDNSTPEPHHDHQNVGDSSMDTSGTSGDLVPPSIDQNCNETGADPVEQGAGNWKTVENKKATRSSNGKFAKKGARVGKTIDTTPLKPVKGGFLPPKRR